MKSRALIAPKARPEVRIASPSRAAQPRNGGPAVNTSVRHRGLAPVIAPDARVLILGSFPSEASLAARQYYAHPRNHFWPILGDVLHEPLAELPYAERLARVKARRVAIWDTIIACERRGSLDAAIRNAEQGEIQHVHRIARGLHAVCFNGKTAARARAAWAQAGYATLVLPSTSPAYTLPIAGKLALWRELARFLEDGAAGTARRTVPE